MDLMFKSLDLANLRCIIHLAVSWNERRSIDPAYP